MDSLDGSYYWQLSIVVVYTELVWFNHTAIFYVAHYIARYLETTGSAPKSKYCQMLYWEFAHSTYSSSLSLAFLVFAIASMQQRTFEASTIVLAKMDLTSVTLQSKPK